jgi:hypothetical protein
MSGDLAVRLPPHQAQSAPTSATRVHHAELLTRAIKSRRRRKTRTRYCLHQVRKTSSRKSTLTVTCRLCGETFSAQRYLNYS